MFGVTMDRSLLFLQCDRCDHLAMLGRSIILFFIFARGAIGGEAVEPSASKPRYNAHRFVFDSVGFRTAEPSSPVFVKTEHFCVSASIEEAKLGEFMRYADQCYPRLATILGFTPNGGRPIALHILPSDDTPYYSPENGGLISIPKQVMNEPRYAGWILVAFPHELTHFFLLQQFPSPPRWFIEGPASYFGDQTADSLGFKAEASENRKRFVDLAEYYTKRRQNYISRKDWPEDQLPDGVPSPGKGAAYQLCSKLNSLCGAEFFPRLFRHMIRDHVSFIGAFTEQQRNWILISAMQRETKEDIWSLFAECGFSIE